MVVLTAYPSGGVEPGTGDAAVVDESLLPLQGRGVFPCVTGRGRQSGVGHIPRLRGSYPTVA